MNEMKSTPCTCIQFCNLEITENNMFTPLFTEQRNVSFLGWRDHCCTAALLNQSAIFSLVYIIKDRRYQSKAEAHTCTGPG